METELKRQDTDGTTLDDLLAIELGNVMYQLEHCRNHDDYIYYEHRKGCIESLLFEKSPTSKMQ